MSKFWENTNVYEVNLRQYTAEGSFKAFAEHLPRLRAMGVDTLWFMPVTPISQQQKKGSLGSYYACSSYTQVSNEFGTLQEWKGLVSVAQAMGFKVIMDWVANHTGWDHEWTRAHPEWYKKDEHTGGFKAAAGMDDIIELDFDNADMRAAMIDAMRFWIEETAIDGFRCDLAFWVRASFWQQAREALDPGRKLFWLGELDVIEHQEYMQVFDAGYTWQWMHHAEKFVKGSYGFHDLMQILQRYQQLPGAKLWFTANHDENSWNGTEFEKYGYLAAGLMVFSATWPGLPLVYSGQEIPNQKRLQFFEKDVLAWEQGCALHSFYKNLLAIRKQASISTFTPVKHFYHHQVLAYEVGAATPLVVLINFSKEAANYHMPVENHANVLLMQDAAVQENHVSLGPGGFAVLTQ